MRCDYILRLESLLKNLLSGNNGYNGTPDMVTLGSMVYKAVFFSPCVCYPHGYFVQGMFTSQMKETSGYQ